MPSISIIIKVLECPNSYETLFSSPLLLIVAIAILIDLYTFYFFS
ncbi:MAG: hypothetical protein QW755_00670 [Nitrososphaerota archaeon]